jgi:ABC-type transporter Mla subunit MlaD
MTDLNPSRQAALFLQLVLGLQQSGMMALGKLMNPLTRQIEKNLDAARDTIDTLAALEARTRGNLETDEARVLTQVLTELRMNYVDEVRKAAGTSESPQG